MQQIKSLIDSFIDERHNEFMTWLDLNSYTDKARTRKLFATGHSEFNTYTDYVADLQDEFDVEVEYESA